MNLFRTSMTFLRSFTQRRAARRDIDEELRFHLERRVAENLATGMTPEQAARDARKRFGNLQTVREECRESRGASLFETTWKDFRFGFRVWRRNPGFAFLVVFTLALGIGSTAAVFTLIQGVLLTPPPYSKPEEIVLMLPERQDGRPYAHGFFPAQWTEWRRANSFESVAGYTWRFDFLCLDNRSEPANGLLVTPDYFQVTGIQPLLGRTFLPSEIHHDPVVILGYDLWQRQFSGDPLIIGKSIHLSRDGFEDLQSRTVVGVMPPGVRFLPAPTAAEYPDYDVNQKVDFWEPMTVDLVNGAKDEFNVAARLRSGVTAAQASSEMKVICTRQALADPNSEGITARVEPLLTELNRAGRRLLLPLFGAVALVFLIACGNVAGLLLARGLQRHQEYSVRSALGAARWQVFQHVLIENLLLALFGGGLGVALAVVLVKLLRLYAGTALPRLDAVVIGWPILAFCASAAILAVILAGFAPALRASRMDPALGIKRSGTSSASRGDRHLLGALVVAQSAMTLALLIGAGLLIRTTANLARETLGYRTQNILTLSVTPLRYDRQSQNIKDEDARTRRFVNFHREAVAQVDALPGVKAAAWAWGVPLTGNKWLGSIAIDGQAPVRTSGGAFRIPMRSVTPEYFSAVSLPLLEGRTFNSHDARDWPPSVSTNVPFDVIINRTLAEQYFPGRDPIGKKMHFSFENVDGDAEVVGLVADSRSEGITKPPEPELYLSFWQLPPGTKHLVVRTALAPAALAGAVQRELRKLNPGVVIEDVKTLDQIRSDSIAPQLITMRLLGGLSLVAGIVSLVGIYGALSLSVASRRREIAIRMAVGARRSTVLRLILTEGLKMVAIAAFIGTAIALAFSNILKALLYGVGTADPATFIFVVIVFTAVALLACFIPARRATRIDPITALRDE